MASLSSQTASKSVSFSMAPSSSQTPFLSHSTSPPTQYDVFLSFRGIDTRNNFISHLYDKLVCSGVRTYMDDPDLSPGDAITDALMQAIKASKIYVVVFSENYASSRWCLDELVEIYKCYETMKRSVIGVYYNIEPSVVRHQTGSFKTAFEKHQTPLKTEKSERDGKRRKIATSAEMEKVNNWRLTLKNVANFSGINISAKRSGADIINKIVHEVLLQIKPKTLYVAINPVGLDSRVKDIAELMLSSGMQGVIKFGIYGMGGVGKTTLAKALFNHLLLKESFKGSCFLANVREVCGTFKGIESLQQQLINDILRSKKEHKVHNVDQGTKYIERFCSAKVLLLIDDIYNHKQYQSLVGPFASGSIVIITTRDEDTLNKIKVESTCRYMLKGLTNAESLALFTKYAFEDAKPNKSFLKLSKKILRLAGKLPLALEIFGSHLSTIKSEVGWESYIEKLERNRDSTITENLLISLNALGSEDPVLKELFLDIACFFIGREKKDVAKILQSCYSYADHKIDILKKRCLLTIGGYGDKLGMHDLLKDMGRDVARNYNSRDDEPGKYSRLWLSKDISDVLKNDKGTEAIEGIIPQTYRQAYRRINGVDKRVSFSAKAFKPMSKLRLLYLNNVNLTGSFEQTFEDLRWLCWKYCPLNYLPSEFHPQKLVILELHCSTMTTMWEPNLVSRVFENLKTLDMSDSIYLTTTPDFTSFPSLKTLNLKGCNSLKDIHISIGSLASLVCLDLSGCVKLIRLPNTICNLRVLEVLTISNCCILEALPPALGNIQSLKKLKASQVNVSILPDSIGRLGKLVKLTLGSKENLKTLPDTICNLRSLEILDISKCRKLKNLPVRLWELTRLRKVQAHKTIRLQKLPDIEKSLPLQTLLLNYSGLTALPSGFSLLRNLVNLSVSGCALSFIEELPPNLKWFNLEKCTSLKRLPNLSNLKQLEELEITGCVSLKEIRGLEELTSLRIFFSHGCSPTLLKYISTRRFFEIILFQFGHQIAILAPFPNWITQLESRGNWITQLESRDNWTRQRTSTRDKASLELSPNVTHNLLGMILCMKLGDTRDYSLTNTTSGFILRGSFNLYWKTSCMIIVPISIFSIRDGDHSIELEIEDAQIFGIHLLYKTENM